MSIQNDWDGEYQPLHNHLHSHGISHCISCPYTHKQNSTIERKHHHIIETGLALMAHASDLPQLYLADTFHTMVYLINRLSYPHLSHLSPYEKVSHQPRNYSFLKILSSTCWPHQVRGRH